MFNEVERLKARYAQSIEDGRKVEVFSSMPEFQWYIQNVLEPTIKEYTDRIMTGKIATDKEDWITRGMVMGLRLMIDGADGFKREAAESRRKAKQLQDDIENDT